MSCARALPFVLLLSACAAQSGSNASPEVIASSVADVIADLSGVGAAPATMPTSGGATYTGYATAFVKETITDQIGRQLVGTAALDATFTAAGARIDGSVGNMLGKTGVNQTELFSAIQNGHAGDIEDILADYSEATGQIAVESTGASGANFEVTIDGTITHEGDALHFDGRGTGNFSGDGATGVQVTGTAGGAGNMTLTENNALRAGTLAVVAAQ
ncbi:hypothetical protein [Maritimibacter alexandrii]|uniref:hypothetical protein n=1 Tax=Maritimibacter alexandrii TaxID=2570355 RepID=UPI001109AB83|nr:hypothetical protein [Maritimibacter alexandrii]